MEHPATDAQQSQHRRSLKAVRMGCAHTSVTDYPVTDDQHMSLGGRRLSNVPSPLPSDWTPPPPASFSIASAGPQPNTAATIAGVVIGALGMLVIFVFLLYKRRAWLQSKSQRAQLDIKRNNTRTSTPTECVVDNSSQQQQHKPPHSGADFAGAGRQEKRTRRPTEGVGGGRDNSLAVAVPASLTGAGPEVCGNGNGVLEMTQELADATSFQLRSDLGAEHLQVHGVIARGGYGTVYRGTWRGLPVAVKTVRFQSVKDRHSFESAVAEAAIANNLTHPNIVATYAHELKATPCPTSNGPEDLVSWKLYLVQELCNGGTLGSLVAAGMLRNSANQVMWLPLLSILFDVARGMAYVHSKRVAHGDLNPNNILLQVENQKEGFGEGGSFNVAQRAVAGMESNTSSAKIADFGLSMRLEAGATHASNIRQGTPFYSAPEVSAHRQLQQASDVFSFGVIMWEMYHSVPPFETRDGGFHPREGFPEFGADTPLAYSVIAHACMSRDPAERPSFAEVVEVLEEMGWQITDAFPGSSHTESATTSFQTKFPPSTSNSVAGLQRESTTPSHNNSMFPLADSAHMGVGRRSTEASYSLSSESRPPTNTRAARSNNNNNNNARRPSAESTYPRNPAASAQDSTVSGADSQSLPLMAKLQAMVRPHPDSSDVNAAADSGAMAARDASPRNGVMMCNNNWPSTRSWSSSPVPMDPSAPPPSSDDAQTSPPRQDSPKYTLANIAMQANAPRLLPVTVTDMKLSPDRMSPLGPSASISITRKISAHPSHAALQQYAPTPLLPPRASHVPLQRYSPTQLPPPRALLLKHPVAIDAHLMKAGSVPIQPPRTAAMTHGHMSLEPGEEAARFQGRAQEPTLPVPALEQVDANSEPTEGPHRLQGVQPIW